jgi:Flp pilus assembly protein TadG
MNKKRGERGITLMMGAMSMVFIIPIIGLSIDVGFVYVIKTKLQAAVDGAALAAARALVLGSDTASQAVSAQNNAVTWFYANFPSGTYGSQNITMSQSDVQVFDDPNNPNLRNVTVNARVQAKSFFMRWLGFSITDIGTTGNASRRDVVAMMVLDRSGSMGISCGDLRAAAKIFTGQFAAGRDRIGLISFSDGTVVHSAPTQNFRSVLGYTNDFGNGSGAIDTIACNGGTATAAGVALAHNELFKINLPGAMNLILLETDGLPNSLHLNWWDAANSTAGIAAGSGCKDTAGKTKSGGGFGSTGVLPNWLGVSSYSAGGYLGTLGPGIIGSFYPDDPFQGAGFLVLSRPWQTSATGGSNSINEGGSGCQFSTGGWTNNISDFAWLPATDIYGDQLNPGTGAYKTPVTMSGTHVSLAGSTATQWTNVHNAALNAADNAAYRARTHATLPVFVFTIGLGGNAGNAPDYVLLQRMANDPNADNFNSPALYGTCASESGQNCVSYTDQPQGTFVFSANRTVLTAAFLQISSQILRLSK